MINDIKKNELNELEMENVAGGYYPDDNNPDNIICLPGLEISENYRVLPSTKYILRITLC